MSDAYGFPERRAAQRPPGEARPTRARLLDVARNPAIDLVAVAVVALTLGLVRLGSLSFWVDEAFTARAMREWSYWQYIEGYHWLYYSLLRPWTELAGTSEVALRLPAVLGSAASCVLLVSLGRRLFDRRVGLAAGLLLATSPFIVKWSQEARGYTLVLAVSLAAMLLLLRALERGRRVDWALYGLALSAVFVWHPVAGLVVVPAHAMLAYQRRGRLLPHGPIALALLLLLAFPWAAQIAMRSTGEGVAMNWLTFPSTRTAVQTVLNVSGAAGLGLVLAAIGIMVLGRAGQRSMAWWLAIWSVSPFAVALLVSTFRPIYLDRYLIVAAPAFALLGGVAIMGAAPRWRVVLVTAAAIATTVGLAQWYSLDASWRGEDWRGAARVVLDRRGEADAVVVVPWSAAPAARYYGLDPVDVASDDRIWVLTWSEAGDDITGAERRALGFGEYVRVEKLPFGRRVSAQLWVRPRH